MSIALCSGPSRTLRAGFAGAASGILDSPCAQRSGGGQVGTEGWPLRSNKGMVFVIATIFGVIARPARRSWVGSGEEPAGQCDVVGPVGIGEEAVVTDAMKSVGQHMDQEAADELVGVERHELVASLALGSVILPFERHALAVEG